MYLYIVKHLCFNADVLPFHFILSKRYTHVYRAEQFHSTMGKKNVLTVRCQADTVTNHIYLQFLFEDNLKREQFDEIFVTFKNLY